MTNAPLSLPSTPTFSQRGLNGYRFPLQNKDLEIYFVDVTQGHDNFIISRKCTHAYYVLQGSGIFCINKEEKKAVQGQLFEIPSGVEYAYSGQMKLLLIMQPPWFEGNEKITRKNPAVK